MAKKTTTADTESNVGADERRIVGLRYIGDGSHFPGIPRRDLDQWDLLRFGAAIDEVQRDGALDRLYAPIYEDEVTNG